MSYRWPNNYHKNRNPNRRVDGSRDGGDRGGGGGNRSHDKNGKFYRNSRGGGDEGGHSSNSWVSTRYEDDRRSASHFADNRRSGSNEQLNDRRFIQGQSTPWGHTHWNQVYSDGYNNSNLYHRRPQHNNDHYHNDRYDEPVVPEVRPSNQDSEPNTHQPHSSTPGSTSSHSSQPNIQTPEQHKSPLDEETIKNSTPSTISSSTTVDERTSCPTHPPVTHANTSPPQGAEAHTTPQRHEKTSTPQSKTPTATVPSRNAEQVTKKILNQLTSMNKHNLKMIINNPNAKYDSALKTHARKKIRAEMRKQLRNFNLTDSSDLHSTIQGMLEPDESIESDKIPEALFEEIGRVLDINLLNEEEFTDDAGDNEENAMGMLDKNLKFKHEEECNLVSAEDIFRRAELLLMGDTSMLEPNEINERLPSPTIMDIEDDKLNDVTVPNVETIMKDVISIVGVNPIISEVTAATTEDPTNTNGESLEDDCILLEKDIETLSVGNSKSPSLLDDDEVMQIDDDINFLTPKESTQKNTKETDDVEVQNIAQELISSIRKTFSEIVEGKSLETPPKQLAADPAPRSWRSPGEKKCIVEVPPPAPAKKENTKKNLNESKKQKVEEKKTEIATTSSTNKDSKIQKKTEEKEKAKEPKTNVMDNSITTLPSSKHNKNKKGNDRKGKSSGETTPAVVVEPPLFSDQISLVKTSSNHISNNKSNSKVTLNNSSAEVKEATKAAKPQNTSHKHKSANEAVPPAKSKDAKESNKRNKDVPIPSTSKSSSKTSDKTKSTEHAKSVTKDASKQSQNKPEPPAMDKVAKDAVKEKEKTNTTVKPLRIKISARNSNHGNIVRDPLEDVISPVGDQIEPPLKTNPPPALPPPHPPTPPHANTKESTVTKSFTLFRAPMNEQLDLLTEMKNIEQQLMDYNKEKMRIDEEILQLHTNKMRIETESITLQNKRVGMLNELIQLNLRQQAQQQEILKKLNCDAVTSGSTSKVLPIAGALDTSAISSDSKRKAKKHKSNKEATNHVVANPTKEIVPLKRQHSDDSIGAELPNKQIRLEKEPEVTPVLMEEEKVPEPPVAVPKTKSKKKRSAKRKEVTPSTVETKEPAVCPPPLVEIPHANIDIEMAVVEQPPPIVIIPIGQPSTTIKPDPSATSPIPPIKTEDPDYAPLLKSRKCHILLNRIPLSVAVESTKPKKSALSGPARPHSRSSSNSSSTPSITEAAEQTPPTIATPVEEKPTPTILKMRMASVSPTPAFDNRFMGHKSPISCMQVYDNYLVAAAEDGHIYRFSLITGKMEKMFSQHKKTVTGVFVDNEDVYSVSLDGTMKKFNLDNFHTELLSVDLEEPLQSMTCKWRNIYIGSRSGNVSCFDLKKKQLSPNFLCSVGKSVMVIEAAKEGPRKILIIAPRSSHISIRDATTGLLLREIEIPFKLTIYSVLQYKSLFYCGTNQNEIISFNFTSGLEVGRMSSGTGSVCIKMYHNLILTGCYDGFIYIHDQETGELVERIQGPGKTILYIDVFNDKIIVSSKDKLLVMINMPQSVLDRRDSVPAVTATATVTAAAT